MPTRRWKPSSTSKIWYRANWKYYRIKKRFGPKLRWIGSDGFQKAINFVAAFVFAGAGIWLAVIANSISDRQADLMELDFNPIWQVLEVDGVVLATESPHQSLSIMNYGAPVAVTSFQETTFWIVRVRVDDDVYQYYDILVPFYGFYSEQVRGDPSSPVVGSFTGSRFGPSNANTELTMMDDLMAVERDGMKVTRISRHSLVSIRYQDRRNREQSVQLWNNDFGQFQEMDSKTASQILGCYRDASGHSIFIRLGEDRESMFERSTDVVRLSSSLVVDPPSERDFGQSGYADCLKLTEELP